MASNTSIDLVHQGLPVTVRLQVWHYNERGRCPQFNHELARLFSSKALGEWNYWTVYPAEVVEPTDISIRDDYVPVEVDFVHQVATYNGSIGNPESGVRDIFKKFAPPIVYDYFVSTIQSPAHAMNTYALANGEAIDNEDIMKKYNHAFFFIPLEFRLKRFIKPAVICQENIIMDILKGGVNSLCVLGSLFLAYTAHQGGQIPKGVGLLTSCKKDLKELSSQLPWLKSMLDNLRGTDEEDSSDARDPENTHTDTGSLTFSDSPSTSFDRLRGLAGGFEIRRDDLRNGEALTNQDVLTALLDLRQVTVHLSQYEQAMVPLSNREIIRWEGEVSSHRQAFYTGGFITIGFAALTILSLWKPEFAKPLAEALAKRLPLSGVATGVGGIGTMMSGGYTYHEYNEMSKSLDTLEDLRRWDSEGRIARQGFLEALRQTQAALAFVYMRQVMRLPEKCMGRDEKDRTFKMLGADLRFLGNGAYEKTFLEDRIQHLLEKAEALEDAYQGIITAMGLVMDTVGVVEEATE